MNTLQIVHILPSEKKTVKMEVPIWGAIVSTVAGAIITGLFYRSLTEAKVKSIVAETYDQLIGTLSSEVASLRAELLRLRTRVDHLSEKELQYMETITKLTQERDELKITIGHKESKIKDLEYQLSKVKQ